MELVLGTAQFGMKYGIAGRGVPIPTDEARQIFARAWELGIRVIDTAPTYGKIQTQLIDLIGNYPFSIISKVPAIPHTLAPEAALDYVSSAIVQMRSSLGERLRTILFHNSRDLFHKDGEQVWQKALGALKGTTIQLGVSCYSPSDAMDLYVRYPIAVAQIPANAFDQRISSILPMAPFEIHLRSVFLQGLLLLSLNEVAMRLPQVAPTINRWNSWCQVQGLTPLQAALGIVKGFSKVRYCVIGVDTLLQLEQIADAWIKTPALYASRLAISDLDVIDPRRWSLEYVQSGGNTI